MCSKRCRSSTSNRCRCSCGGLYHGRNADYSLYMQGLERRFPPCTPVRFETTYSEGPIYGRVGDFTIAGGDLFVFVEPYKLALPVEKVTFYEKGKLQIKRRNNGTKNKD